MKKIVHILVFSLLGICSSQYMNAQPELAAAAKVDRNVVYGMYSGLGLLLDVYYPQDPNGYGVIHISGSGWARPLGLDAPMLNHQAHVQLEAAALVAAGYTVFSVNHRATPRFTYPAAVEDVQRAVRFIRYHADKYHINADRIGAVGGSSGGQLVSMLGVLDGNGLDDNSPINQVSAKVQCVVARAAPTNLMHGAAAPFLGISHNDDPKSTESRIAWEASPINYLTADDPPFLFLHGVLDEAVPIAMADEMHAALLKLNIPSKLIRLEGAGHGPDFPGAINPPDLDQARVDWLNQHLKLH